MVASFNPSFNMGNDLGKIDRKWRNIYIGNIYSDFVEIKGGGLNIVNSPDTNPGLNAANFGNNNIYIRYNRNNKFGISNGGNELNSILDNIDNDLEYISNDFNSFKFLCALLFKKIENSYWNDPYTIDNFNGIDPDNFHQSMDPDVTITYPLKQGEVFLDLDNKNLLFFVPDITVYKNARQFSIDNPDIDPANIPNYYSYQQPQDWIDANRLEGFLTLSLGFNKDDFATKVFVNSTVDTAIANLIDGAPDILDTLNEIATAINNDPDVFNTLKTLIDTLANNTYRKDETYNKTEVDTLINNLSATSSKKPWDYFIGSDTARGEINNIADVYTQINQNNLAQNPQKSIPKTLLIKPDATGLYNQNTNILQLSIANIYQQSLYKNADDYVKFKKIEVDVSNAIYSNGIITFENVQIEQIKILDSQNSKIPYTIRIINCLITNSSDSRLIINDDSGNPNVKIEIRNSKVKNNFNNNAIYLKKGQIFIEESEISYLNENLGIDVISLWQSQNNFNTLTDLKTYCEINNSKIYGVSQINDNAKLKIRNSIILNSSDTYNGPLLYATDVNTTLDLQTVHFYKKENTQTTDTHIAGTGNCYVDHNIYELSFRLDGSGNIILDGEKPIAREVGFEPSINNGKGITTEFFYKPLGYNLFFYDDERARDTIANALTASQQQDGTSLPFFEDEGYENYPHNPKGIEFKHYDDINLIGLDISGVNVHDLTDGNKVAFKDEMNFFTANQNLIAGVKAYENVSIGNYDIKTVDPDVYFDTNLSLKSQGLTVDGLPSLFELRGDYIEIKRNTDVLNDYIFQEALTTDTLIFDTINSNPFADPPEYIYLPTFKFDDSIWTSVKDPVYNSNIANKNYVDTEITAVFSALNNIKLDDVTDVNTTGWQRDALGNILTDVNTGDKLKSTTQDGMILSYGPHETNDLDYNPGKIEDWHPKFINARPSFNFYADSDPNEVLQSINNTPFEGVYELDNVKNTYNFINTQDWYDIVYNTDSLFRLRGVLPLDTTKTDHIENGIDGSLAGVSDYWSADEYSLFWNNQITNQLDGLKNKIHPDLQNDEPVHTAQEFDGAGGYEPVAVQNKIRLAKNYTFHATDASLRHDGAGKVYIAKANETKFGNNSGSYTYNTRNRAGFPTTVTDNYVTPTSVGYAVRPQDLFAAYARRDMTNLTRATLGATSGNRILRHEDEVNYARWNLGFITDFDINSDKVYLKYDRSSDEYKSVDATFQYYDYLQIQPVDEISGIVNSGLDDASLPWNPIEAKLNRYYFVTCSTNVNEKNLIILPEITADSIGHSIVVKKENALGKLLIWTKIPNSERFLLQDGVTISQDQLTGFVQIDIDNMGQVIKFMSNGNPADPYWIVEGFFGNGGVGFDVNSNREIIQDRIIAPFFVHDPIEPVTHDPAISFEYDAVADANDRIIAKINFATQEEVDEGTITNKPIAPDTLSTKLSAYVLTDDFSGLFDTNVGSSTTLTTKISNQISGKEDKSNLKTAAYKDVGILTGNVPEIGSNLSNNSFIITDSSGKLKTGTITSTETTLGLIRLATQEEVDAGTGSDAVTPEKLLNTIEGNTVIRQKIIQAVSATYFYEQLIGSASAAAPPPTGNFPEFDLEIGKYYSVTTDNSGQITLNLPLISTSAVAGSIVRVKFKENLSGFNIKIKPNGSDKIDTLNQWILEYKGQSITLVSDGISEWEIN